MKHDAKNNDKENKGAQIKDILKHHFKPIGFCVYEKYK